MRRSFGIIFGLLISSPAFAGILLVADTKVESIYVNGGADTVNPGTTCLKMASPVSSVCPNGMVAIQNNNRELVAAAMQAKATGARVAFYYSDTGGPFHCPQIALTPCSVVVLVVN